MVDRVDLLEFNRCPQLRAIQYGAENTDKAGGKTAPVNLCAKFLFCGEKIELGVFIDDQGSGVQVQYLSTKF